MATPFQTFVNTELPKRPFTQDAAVAWTPGRVLVTTGVALGVTTEVFPAPPVTSVNSSTGAVVITADSLSAIPTSQKGAASGVASLDASGFVPMSQMNPGVVERLYVVTNQAARFALTTAQVQNGDVVKQELPAPAAMYYVHDDTNLDSELGYAIFAVGTAAAVAWSGVTGVPQVLLDLQNISGAVAGDILKFDGTNWVKQSRDSYVSDLNLQVSEIEGLQDDLDGKQAHDPALDALSDLPGTGFIVQIAKDSFTSRSLKAGDNISITYPDGVNGNPLIALTEGPAEAAGTHGDENTYVGLVIDSHGRTTLATPYSLQKDTVYIPNSTDTFTLATKTLYMVGDFFLTTTYGNLNLQLPPLTTSTVIEIQFAFNLVQTAKLNLFPDGTDLILGATPSIDLNNLLKVRPGCTLRLMYHSPDIGWAPTVSYSDQMGTLSVNNETSLTHTHRHKILSDATEDRTINLPDNDLNLGQVITSFSFDKTTSVLTANLADTTTSTTLLNESHVTRLLDPDGAIGSVPLNIGYTYRPAGATPLLAPDGIPNGTEVWLPSATLDAFESHKSIPIRIFIGNHISDNGYIRLTPQVSDDLMYLDSTGATSTTNTWIDIPNYSIVTCYMVGANLWFVDVRQDVNCVGSDHFSVVDPADRTKSVKLNVAPVATATQRTITVPNADVSLGKIPTGVTPNYTSGKLMVPLADGTSIPLSTFGGTHLTGPNTPATPLVANGHYFFYVDTGSQYTGVRQLSLPESPTDLTYIRLSNLCSVSAFAAGAGATIAPGGSDKINGVAATLGITQFLTEYQNAVITLTYSTAHANWTVAVTGDLIKPGTVAIYDADKTNTTTLTPVTNLTANRVITLPDANVDLGKVLSNISYAPTTGVITLTNVDATTIATTNTGVIADDMLRIQATGDATKKMGFDASPITAGQTRIVVMPDRNVFLGQLEPYSAAPFEVNAVSIWQDKLYRCVSATSGSGTLDPSKWKEVGKSRRDVVVLTASATLNHTTDYLVQSFDSGSGIGNITLTMPDNLATVEKDFITVDFNRFTGTKVTLVSGAGDSNNFINPDGYTFTSPHDLSVTTGMKLELIPIRYSSNNKVVYWMIKTFFTGLIPVGTVGSGHATGLSKYGDSTAVTQITSNVATGTTRTLTLPDVDVDLSAVPNSTSSTVVPQDTAFVYATGMGSVVKTITGTGTTFNVDALASNRAHSVTIRNNADNLYPFNTPVTFQFVSAKTGGFAYSGFVDAQGLGFHESYVHSAAPLSITLEVNESIEVRYIGSNGAGGEIFSMQRNLVGLVPIPASTTSFKLYPERKYSLPHAYSDVLNLQLPIVERVGTSITLEDVVGTSSSTITALNITAGSSQTIRGSSSVNIKNLIDNGCTVKLVFLGSSNWVLNVQYSSTIRGNTLGVRNIAGNLTSFNVSAATALRTVTFPNADVDLGQMVSIQSLRYSITDQALAATYTVANTDVTAYGNKIINCTNSGAGSITVPTPTSLTATVGDSFTIRQAGTGGVTLSGTISGPTTLSTQNSTLTLIANSTTSWISIGG